MFHRRQVCLLVLSAVLCTAADPPWKVKQAADWTEDDARLLLTDSPWAGSVAPKVLAEGRNARGGGIGGTGIGIGMPGMGRGGPGRGTSSPPPDSASAPSADAPRLRLRWESARPVREAEFKARETNAPDVDESCYAIAVYGVPSRMARGSEKTLAAEFKREAALRREGQKDLKPSSVAVLQRDDGPVIVYQFPRKTEITRQDGTVEFSAQIARLQVSKVFSIADMMVQGKLEL